MKAKSLMFARRHARPLAAPAVYNNDGELLLCSPQACDNGVWPALNGENNIGDGELDVKFSCRRVAAEYAFNVGTESDLAPEGQKARKNMRV